MFKGLFGSERFLQSTALISLLSVNLSSVFVGILQHLPYGGQFKAASKQQGTTFPTSSLLIPTFIDGLASLSPLSSDSVLGTLLTSGFAESFHFLRVFGEGFGQY